MLYMNKNLCFICIMHNISVTRATLGLFTFCLVRNIVIRSSSLDLSVATLDALEAEEMQMEYKKEL